jgi:hypothetical protein
MNPEPDKIQELIRATHIIAYEGYYHSIEKGDQYDASMYYVILELLSKAIIKKEGKKVRR